MTSQEPNPNHKSAENHEELASKNYEELLKEILPQVSTDENKMILAQVLVALKLHGLIGKNISPHDSKMIQVVKDTIVNSPEKKRLAMLIAQQIIEEKNDAKY